MKKLTIYGVAFFYKEKLKLVAYHLIAYTDFKPKYNHTLLCKVLISAQNSNQSAQTMHTH